MHSCQAHRGAARSARSGGPLGDRQRSGGPLGHRLAGRQGNPRGVSAVLLFLALAAPAALGAQSIEDLRRAMNEGGGWVSVDIKGGRGTLQSAPVPTVGLQLSGFIRVWDQNPGTWRIRARDLSRDQSVLEVATRAGQAVPFSYRTGIVSQLRVDIQWSEADDTTLWVWVGLDRGDGSGRSERSRGPGS